MHGICIILGSGTYSTTHMAASTGGAVGIVRGHLTVTTIHGTVGTHHGSPHGIPTGIPTIHFTGGHHIMDITIHGTITIVTIGVIMRHTTHHTATKAGIVIMEGGFLNHPMVNRATKLPLRGH